MSGVTLKLDDDCWWLLFKLDFSWWWTSSLIYSLANIVNEYQCACDDDFQGVNCTEPLVTDPTNHFILALATFTLSILLAVIVLTAYCLHQARNPVNSAPLIRPTCSTPLQVRLIRSEKRELAWIGVVKNTTQQHYAETWENTTQQHYAGRGRRIRTWEHFSARYYWCWLHWLLQV